MRAFRHSFRSLGVLAALLLAAASSHAQEPPQPVSVQQLVERGALDEAVQRAQGEQDNPEATFHAAVALVKMKNDAGASERYEHLQHNPDPSWQAIGESGVKLMAGDLDGARQAAQRAVEANGENPYAHYQRGTVAIRQNDFEQAAAAFTRAAELKPDFAYAHYYAGLAHQRLKHIPEMAAHFEAFMRLAPEAPERTAVAAILRTLRR
jgi:tetratricopeptide (TPR) repeat protein